MPHKDFDSTALKSADYDRKSKQLSITFHSGGTTVYEDVPEEVFDGLCKAKSAGGYFHKAIRGVFVHL